MSTPDFDRAEYLQPQAMAPQIMPMPLDASPVEPASGSAFPLALAAGAVAAFAGSIGYALFSLRALWWASWPSGSRG